MKQFEFTAQDGTNIVAYLWANVAQPKGVVQLIHGMSEHMERYNDFAEKLNQAGFVVIGDDHRGHGKTAGAVEKVGTAQGDIFYKTMKDELFITENALKVYKGLPYFVIGHSYGSFIAQKYIQTNSKKVDGAVLIGSTCTKNRVMDFFGAGVCLFAKKSARANLFKKMSFDRYNKAIVKTGSTDGSTWISRDVNVCKAYNEDPLCNQVFTFGFYKSLFYNLRRLFQRADMNRLRTNFPLLILGGSCDQLSKNGAGVQKLHEVYQHHGLTEVQCKIYEGARHELLNETNHDEVYQDILQFLNHAIELKKENQKQADSDKKERAVYFQQAMKEAAQLDMEFRKEKAERMAAEALAEKDKASKKK